MPSLEVAGMKNKPGKTLRTGFGDESARPVIDYERCNRCGLCFKACPSGTTFDRDGTPAVDIDRGSGCLACGWCMSVCSQEAIRVTGRRMLPEDAFPLPPPAKRADADALSGLLASRRSVRSYKEQEIEQSVLERILEMAGLAPMGLPPTDVSVLLVNGREKVRRFGADTIEAFRKMIGAMGPILPLMRPFMGKEQYAGLKDFVIPITKEIVADHDRGVDHLFYDAPAVMVFHRHPGGDAGDGFIACTYAMIAAQSLGLGTCMIGTVAPFLQREKSVAAKWGIPKGNKLEIAMILGYPTLKPTRGIRRRFSQVRWA
jgi:ferredoxin